MAKLDLFDNQLQVTAMVFKTFSHPARLAILNLLAEKESCKAGDISKALPLSRTTVNQHIYELRELGLVREKKTGAKVMYSLSAEMFEKSKQNMKAFMDQILDQV